MELHVWYWKIKKNRFFLVQANRTFTKEAFKNQKLGENRVNNMHRVSSEKRWVWCKNKWRVGIGVKKTGPTNFMAIKNYGGLPFAKLSLFSTKVQSSARALTAWDGVQKWEKKLFFTRKKIITLKLWCESWFVVRLSTKFKNSYKQVWCKKYTM